MKYLAIFYILTPALCSSQIPEWYKEEMQRQVGIWVADNKAYMSEQETDDAYAVEWTSGAGGQSLLGVLYGLKNKEKTYEYWQFIQFWDIEKSQPRIIQISAFGGTTAEGFLEQVDDTHTKLVQTFIAPNGKTSLSGHKTEIYGNSERSTSFSIDNGNWIENRSYIWVKENASMSEQSSYELYLTQISAAEAFLQLKKISTAKTYLDSCDPKYRGLEWDFLNAYLDQSQHTFKPEKAERFTAIKLSNDGKIMAVGDSNGNITLYSYPEFNVQKVLKGHDGAITTLDFDATNSMVISGSRDHKVIGWDIEKGKPFFENITAFSQGIYNLKFSPDYKTIGVVSWEMTKNPVPVMGFLKFLDPKTGKEVLRIDNEPHPSAGIVFSKDGEKIYVNTWGQITFCYDRKTGKELWRYDLSNNDEYNNFQEMDLSPDGKVIALASLDHRVHFIESETGKVIHKIEPWIGHSKGVIVVKFSPNGKLVATAGDDEIVKIWDTSNYNQVNDLIGHVGTITDLEWNRDGTKLYSVSADGTMKFWDLSKPFEIKSDVCTNGPWQLPTTSKTNLFAAPCSDQHISIYNIITREQVFNVENYNGLSADFSKDDSLLVTAGFDGIVNLWDVNKVQLIKAFKGHTERIDGVAYLSNTNQIASVGDKTLRVWNRTNDEPILTKTFGTSPFRVVANANETRIYVGFNDGTIKVFNTTTWEELTSFNTTASLNEMSISPDDNYLGVFVGNTIDIRNPNTGEQIYAFDEHQKRGYALDFSPDGKYLITGSYDQTFKFWNLENGTCTLTFNGYDNIVYQTKFLDDHRLLVSTSNGIVYCYDFNSNR